MLSLNTETQTLSPVRDEDIQRPATSVPEPLLVSVEEACRLLGIGRTKAFAMLQPGGSLDSVKIGRATRVKMASVRRLAGEV